MDSSNPEVSDLRYMNAHMKVGVSDEIQDEILKKKYRTTSNDSVNDSNDSHDSFKRASPTYSRTLFILAIMPVDSKGFKI